MKYLLVYWFKSIEPKKRLEFNRKLYGYTDHSNFGSYSYFREGVLKDYTKLTKGVILINKKPKQLIKLLKQYKANYKIFKIV